MSFTGALIQLKRSNSNTYDNFPSDWIVEKSFKPTPNQRLDTSDSKRDTTGHLHRTVLSYKPSKIEFNLRRMTNVEINAFNTFMKNHFTDPLKREFTMRFYNVETDNYTTGVFYMPDPEYTIRQIDTTKNLIKYEETRIAFIQN